MIKNIDTAQLAWEIENILSNNMTFKSGQYWGSWISNDEHFTENVSKRIVCMLITELQDSNDHAIYGGKK